MNELVEFNFEGKEVRTLMVEEEPWWVGVDICDILEIKQPSTALGKLEGNEKKVIYYKDIQKYASRLKQLGHTNNLTLVNEPGLIMLMIYSRKKETLPFKRWIAHEVIPQIRKTGMYTPENAELVITDELLNSARFDISDSSTLLLKYHEVNNKLIEKKLLNSRQFRIMQRTAESALIQAQKNMLTPQIIADIHHDDADVFTVTEIGKMLGEYSARFVNATLLAMNFQERMSLPNHYRATELGKPYSIMKTSTVRGNVVHLLRWKESVVDQILEHLTSDSGGNNNEW